MAEVKKTRRISVGGESFPEIRRNGSYYVDKTELIYELAAETDNKVTVFTRPRRFGKTLNMSMIEAFFDIAQPETKDLFQGLDISEHTDFCREYQNQYPVLFLSLKDVEGRSFELAFDKMKAVIADLCKKHTGLSQIPVPGRYLKNSVCSPQTKQMCRTA